MGFLGSDGVALYIGGNGQRFKRLAPRYPRKRKGRPGHAGPP